MLTRKTPKTFKANLTVKAAGESIPLALTFYNRKTAELVELAERPETFKLPDNLARPKLHPVIYGNAQIVLFLVKQYDDGTEQDYPLTLDGLLDMEDDYAGVLAGIIQAYHQSRTATVEKN